MRFEEAQAQLSAEDFAKAKSVGEAWGAQEIECWSDQHEGSDSRPDWTWGQYQGTIPFDREDTRYDAFEFVVDYFAKEVWESTEFIAIAVR